MDENGKKRRYIGVSVINAAIVALYFIIIFINLPNTKYSLTADLGLIEISFPIFLISIIMMIFEKHLRLWIVPDIIYCLLIFIVYNEDYHPYIINKLDNYYFFYDKEEVLIESVIILVLMLIVQGFVRLIMGIIKRVKH